MLSDRNVITLINDNFIPVSIDVFSEGWPEWAGLEIWRKPFLERYNRTNGKDVANYRGGFSRSIVLDPDGEHPLGWSGPNRREEFKTSVNCQPEPFSDFLNETLKDYQSKVVVRKDQAKSDKRKATETRPRPPPI